MINNFLFFRLNFLIDLITIKYHRILEILWLFDTRKIHFFNVIYGREEAALCLLPRYIILRDGMLDEDDVLTNDVTALEVFKCYMINN